MKLRAIAINTFKEAVRNKIYYLLIAFGIVFAFSSRLVSLLTLGDQVRVLKNVGLASINFFSVLIAIFTGINLIYKEIDKKTILNIMSKPISRRDFILGKFLGLSYTLLVALVSMATVFLLFLLISTGDIDWNILVYFCLLYFELLIIISISLVFSSFSTPILSSIFTINLYLIGHVLWTFNEFKTRLVEPITRIIIYLIYYILPNLEKFNLRDQIVSNEKINPMIVLTSILYALVYIAAMLTLAILIFNKREFK
ncbi:MAG: ABC transporter permease subunit [Candidatus Aminicenantes bacterium]|nr:ABC transporter permease subunit [Candidatus Aminicenantes bacterium]